MSNDLIRKLTYTAEAIQDITKALEERKFDMSSVELMRYGDIIRSIKSITDESEDVKTDYYIFYVKNPKEVTKSDLLNTNLI